jgi:CheY-like chemotaxis protein
MCWWSTTSLCSPAWLPPTWNWAGFSTTVCGDGNEAVELARTEDPMVIILDLGLPGLDGVEAFRPTPPEPAMPAAPGSALR